MHVAEADRDVRLFERGHLEPARPADVHAAEHRDVDGQARVSPLRRRDRGTAISGLPPGRRARVPGARNTGGGRRRAACPRACRGTGVGSCRRAARSCPPICKRTAATSWHDQVTCAMREPDQRVLAHRQRLAALERVAHVAPRLVDQRARGAIRCPRPSRILRGSCRWCSACRRVRRARARSRRARRAGAAADAARPARVTHDGEADDADRVERAAALRRLGDAKCVYASGTNTFVDLCSRCCRSRAGPARPSCRSASPCSTGSTKIRGSPVPSMTPSVWMWVPCLMPDAKLHEPLRLKPPFSERRCRAACLARRSRANASPPNSSLDRRIAEVRGAGADRERRGHQHPTRRRIAVRDVLDDLERATPGRARRRRDRPSAPTCRAGLRCAAPRRPALRACRSCLRIRRARSRAPDAFRTLR